MTKGNQTGVYANVEDGILMLTDFECNYLVNIIRESQKKHGKKYPDANRLSEKLLEKLNNL